MTKFMYIGMSTRDVIQEINVLRSNTYFDCFVQGNGVWGGSYYKAHDSNGKGDTGICCWT